MGAPDESRLRWGSLELVPAGWKRRLTEPRPRQEMSPSFAPSRSSTEAARLVAMAVPRRYHFLSRVPVRRGAARSCLVVGDTAHTLTRYTTPRYDASDGDPQFRQPGRRAILPGGATLEGCRLGERREGRCQEARHARLRGGPQDLASPPGNRLEALKGKLGGFHSIRINDQWRLVFRWTDSGPAEVDIRDYH